jgi:hypothetical protein
MPVCHCREGLKILPAVLINLAPAVLMYSVLFIMTIRGFTFLLIIFLPFFIAFDLTAVIYILFFKIRHKADYIALNFHIYDVTLFRGTYIIKTGNKKAEAKPRVNVHALIKQKERAKLFTEMQTCVNYNCGNYGLELDSDKDKGGKKQKKCPSCGKRKYTAKVFTGMMTCTNWQCGQFGHELKTEIEDCGICGAKIGQIALKFNPGLVIPSVVAAAVSCIFYAAVTLAMFDRGVDIAQDSVLLNILNFFMFAVHITGAAAAWISKSRKALAFAVISLPLTALILRLVVF